MEALAPAHQLLLDVSHSMACGDGLRAGILKYLQKSKGSYPNQVRQWLILIEQSALTPSFFLSINEPYRRLLLEVLTQGWVGRPILETLNRLEVEFEELSSLEIERNLQLMPFKMMIPLLLLQFPAIFLLLVGPILVTLLNQLGGQ